METSQEVKGNINNLILHEQEKCIGCGACASFVPDFWEMLELNDEVKSHLKNSNKNGTHETLKVDDKNAELNKQAEDVCPVSCIHVNPKQ